MSKLMPKLLQRPSFLAATVLALLAAAPPASAISIDLSYDEDDQPAFDPDGAKLKAIARAAADRWQWHILDDDDWHFDISWDNLDDENRMAKYVPSYVPFDSIDIVISTHMNGMPIPWFFDETPYADEEFGPLIQTLVRDLDPVHADEAYAGPNVPLLEAGAFAVAPVGTTAGSGFDLLTFLTHEMGHALGMNFSLTDDDYDFDSADIGGLDVGAFEAEGYELVLKTALMNDSVARLGRRTFPSATDILATHDQSDFTNYNLRRIDLLGAHSNDWNDTLNWIGGKAPEWFNDTFVRNGGSVRLESGLAEARTLLVDEGSSVFTANSSHLKVIHELRVGNAAVGTRGEVHVGNLVGVPWLEAGSFRIDNGLVNLSSQNAVLVSHGKLQIGPQGTLMGGGQVEVQGELNNDGEISAGMFLLFGFGGDLFLRAIDNGKLDLDGGQERVLDPGRSALAFPGGFNDEYGRISAVNGNLRIVSPLADAFNGTATVGAGRTMHFYQPWSFGGNLVMRGGSTAATAATLTGGEIQFGGDTTVEGVATIDAPLVTGFFTNIRVMSGGRLNLVGHHIGPAANMLDYGGKFALENGATLNVNLSGASWTLKRSLTMGPGSTVTGDDLVNFGGRIEGSGNLAVNRVDNAGIVAPTGELRIPTGLYAQSWMGKLLIDLAGFSQGVNYDVLRVGGDAHIAGGVEITLAEGFLPAVGAQFDVLAAANVFGAFPSFEVWAPADVEFSGQLVYLPGKVAFRVTRSNFAADFDADGDVDGDDMSAWSIALAAGGPGVNGEGDANHDYIVDGADFLILQRQLGRRVASLPTGGRGGIGGGTIGGGITRNVPEPASGMLALGAFVSATVATRRCNILNGRLAH